MIKLENKFLGKLKILEKRINEYNYIDETLNINEKNYFYESNIIILSGLFEQYFEKFIKKYIFLINEFIRNNEVSIPESIIENNKKYTINFFKKNFIKKRKNFYNEKKMLSNLIPFNDENKKFLNPESFIFTRFGNLYNDEILKILNNFNFSENKITEKILYLNVFLKKYFLKKYDIKEKFYKDQNLIFRKKLDDFLERRNSISHGYNNKNLILSKNFLLNDITLIKNLYLSIIDIMLSNFLQYIYKNKDKINNLEIIYRKKNIYKNNNQKNLKMTISKNKIQNISDDIIFYMKDNQNNFFINKLVKSNQNNKKYILFFEKDLYNIEEILFFEI